MYNRKMPEKWSALARLCPGNPVSRIGPYSTRSCDSAKSGLRGGTNLHLGVFHLYPHFFILSEVFISSPLFHLSSVFFRILSGSSSRILAFLPHLIRPDDICSIRLHLILPASSSLHCLIFLNISISAAQTGVQSTDEASERFVQVKLQPDEDIKGSYLSNCTCKGVEGSD